MTELVLIFLGFGAWLLWRVFRQDWSAGEGIRPSPQAHYESTERANMPEEVAYGQLILSEAKFVASHPVPLVARVDQAFETPTGQVVLVETKTRYSHRVFDYDVIELSAQACVLRHSRDVKLPGPIAPYAYVRAVAEGRAPAYLRVQLLPEEAIVALYRRHQDLMTRNVAPRPTAQPALCRRCPQVGRCPHPQGVVA